MKNRKVNIGRKNPSSAEIANYKDFSALQNQISATGSSAGTSSLSKNGWFAIGTAIVTVVLVVGSFIFGNKKKKQQEHLAQHTTIGIADTIESQRNHHPFINPISDKTNIPYETYTLQAKKGTTLKHPSGSEIDIPKNAFIDENGKVVKGEVIVKYREFHNQLDILKAGIPMDYDSAGSTHLESAGMLEIRAYQNNKPLFCNPDAPININMTSYKEDNDYNVYFLNEEEREWQYKGKDEKVVLDVLDELVDNNYTRESELTDNDSKSTGEAELTEIKNIAIKNVNFNDSVWSVRNKKGQPILGETYYFTIEDIIPWQPEMAALDSITWKYQRKLQKGVAGTKFFEDCLSFITKPGDHLYRYWDVIIVTYEAGAEFLTFTFRTEGKKDSQANLKPVFNKGKEKQTCGELYAAYKYNVQTKNRPTANSYREMKRKLGNKIKDGDYVSRSFRIDGFGYWNCDRIFNARSRFKNYITTIDYPGIQQDSSRITDCFFIENNINSVMNVSSKNCYYLPDGEGFLVTVFNNGKMGYCALNKKATVNKEAKTMDCPLTIVNNVIDGVDELKQKMGVGIMKLPS